MYHIDTSFWSDNNHFSNECQFFFLHYQIKLFRFDGLLQTNVGKCLFVIEIKMSHSLQNYHLIRLDFTKMGKKNVRNEQSTSH